jgi:hypothetical protein
MTVTQHVPTRALFVAFNGQPVAANAPLLAAKRLGVWGNVERNKLVTNVAAGMAQAARKTLRKLGASTKDVILPDRVRQRVVVLAETAEHARRLAKYLPTWEVLDAVPVVPSNYCDWEGEPDTDDEQPPGRIVTLVYTARYGIACDILVRATAGTGLLSWDMVRGRSGKAGTTPFLVIDVEDQSGERERLNTAIRRREYTEHGLAELKTTIQKKGAQYT